jgi:glycosyltransferase involved in cell wall biosynthesis
LKILLTHNFYQSSSPSGEDAVYGHEAEMLRSRDVEIIRCERHNDEIKNPLPAAFGAVWSRRTYQEITSLIKKEKPDVAHFHNIWYLISPSAYYACKDAGVPVVQTLHNFRMFCSNGLLLKGGKVCDDCIGKIPWRGAAFGCYRNSRLYSVPVAFTEMVHQARGTWVNAVDAYIALTEFGKQKFIECGLPAEKIYVKPNFLSHPPNLIAEPLNVLTSPQHYAVFIGRLSQEKGVDVLLDAFKRLNCKLLLKVVGDGPLLAELNRQQLPAVEFAGRKSHAECMEILTHARFLILPSVCYENFPMTIIEAFACGKPVIASKLGAMASVVGDGKTGLLFEPGNPEALANAIKRLWEDEALCAEMGKNARAEFEAKYTADRNFEMLMGIYNQILAKGDRLRAHKRQRAKG